MPDRRIECLEDAAEAIDATGSWQFLAARRVDDDIFSIRAVSRGSIPLLANTAFEGIEACVDIDSEDREAFSKMHVVHYQGDLTGLEMFIGYLSGKLDGITEGHEDPIGDFVSRHPLWPLSVF